MALTKFEIASSALVMIGANPVASFSSSGTAEEIACHYLYQTCVDHWLSLFPWRFASKTSQLPRIANAPSTLWQAAYTVPAGMGAIQAIRVDVHGGDIPFDRFENTVLCNATATQAVFAVHTYEPPVAWWPGYFEQLVEVALASKLAFALSAKLDLRADLGKEVETYFRLAKNADSRQQTNRKFRLTGRRSIMEARLS
jgi:hypothetical protein